MNTSGKPMQVLEPKEIKVEITTDTALLEQYFQLREYCYRQDLGLADFSGAREEYDDRGVIAVARQGDKVIGGSRMIMSLPGKPCRLPLEEDGFVMKDLFPMLELDTNGYFEIGRTAVDSSYRRSDVNFEVNKLLVLHALETGCYYQFTVSTVKLFRVNRIIGHKLAMEHFLADWVKVPHKGIYEKLNQEGIHLSVSFIRPEETTKQKRMLFGHAMPVKDESVSA